jgi:Na+/H+ antiporter NhaB
MSQVPGLGQNVSDALTTLSQNVRNSLSTCTFDKFYMTIANQVTKIVHLDIHLSRSRLVGFSLIIIHDALS